MSSDLDTRPARGASFHTLGGHAGPLRAGARFYTGAADALLDALMVDGGSGMVAVCNVHMLVEAGRDADLAAALRGADFAVCDGQPVAWLLGLLTGRAVARITGPDIFSAVLDGGLARLRVALVGGDAAMLAAIRETVAEGDRGNLLLLDPGRVAEGEGPSPAMLEALRAFRPAIVFVGLGCPKQEKWMAQAVGQTRARYIGVGAAFEYRVGHIRRAPKAMQVSGAEWLFRAAQQPRLIGRYLSTGVPFLGLLIGAAVARIRSGRAVAVLGRRRGDADLGA